jgi:hypothetical protein
MCMDGMMRGQIGREAYTAYLVRTVFPDYVKEAVEAFIGTMHQKPPTIELPAALEGMRNEATATGESLELLLRRINEEQLTTGRVGLLLDLPSESDTDIEPYIALYTAESIRNWDDASGARGRSELNLVVLDETGVYRKDDGFTWGTEKRYRVLQLGELVANEFEDTPGVYYQVGVFSNRDGKDLEYDPSLMTTPSIVGSPLEEIPFVFINSKDIVAQPDEPPLMGLGRLALTVYRAEADYRQNLFMQGQDTLVVIGTRTINNSLKPENEPVRTGAGSMLEVDMGGDAKYIGVGSAGLGEQRSSLENDRKRAETKAGQLVNMTRGGNNESGLALQLRIGAQTATLNQIALAGAAALEKLLKMAAEWVGADPDEVRVSPNLEFSNLELTGQDLVAFMTAKNMGAPISNASIHAMLVQRGITSLDYESELDAIEDEPPTMRPLAPMTPEAPAALELTPAGDIREAGEGEAADGDVLGQ